jgi:hypothetical protein
MTDTNQIIATLNEMLSPEKRQGTNLPEMLDHVPQIVCADGFTLSVQASKYHYCSPRDSFGPWTSVEVGFPSEKVDAFMPYCDGDESDPTDTVYGWVPMFLVAETIGAHGGFKIVEAA